MSQRTKVYAFLAALVLVIGGAYFLNEKFHFIGGVAEAEANEEENEDEQSRVPVELSIAETGEISSFIDSTGNLRALRDIEVATQVEGIVRRVLVEEGDYVKRGQLLCKIDDAQVTINLELARERLAQSKVQLEKAKINFEKAGVQIDNTRTEFERYSRAHEDGLVSETEVATRKYQLDELIHDHRVSRSEIKELEHRVAELEAEIAQSQLQISLTEIKAPFGGFITERTVEMGQRVRNLDALFKLGSFSPLYADVFLSERDARAVTPGQTALLSLGSDGSEMVTGRVKRIAPVVDQETGTVKVTVEVATREPGFKPGAFVRVALETDTLTEALLIPKKAVIEQDGENFVFVAESEKARRVKVVLGYEHEGIVQIRSGLTSGEKVVVAGQGALKEGDELKVIEG
jgi:membrane fusion protein (multidrug efflux system)